MRMVRQEEAEEEDTWAGTHLEAPFRVSLEGSRLRPNGGLVRLFSRQGQRIQRIINIARIKARNRIVDARSSRCFPAPRTTLGILLARLATRRLDRLGR